MRAQRTISVVGCHAEGEVGDVVIGGVLAPAGDTVFEMMQTMERDHDHIRRLLICEPRGSVARHVNVLVPPKSPGCHAGAIIMEPTEYVPMSGSNTMCIATVLLETGMVEMTEPTTTLRLDMPGGVVEVTCECRDGKCVSVEISNVACFVDRLDATVEVEGVGSVKIDVAYGGMFYGIVDVTRLGMAIEPEQARELGDLGERIRIAAREQLDVVHPENPGIRGVSIVQLNEPFVAPGQPVRNTCIVSPGRSDRSPTGTGTCARMAVLHARGQLRVGEGLTHESIIGSQFIGMIRGETTLASGRSAILPTVRGRAWITGFHTYVLDPSDPYPQGYIVADTWGRTMSMTQT